MAAGLEARCGADVDVPFRSGREPCREAGGSIAHRVEYQAWQFIARREQSNDVKGRKGMRAAVPLDTLPDRVLLGRISRTPCVVRVRAPPTRDHPERIRLRRVPARFSKPR